MTTCGRCTLMQPQQCFQEPEHLPSLRVSQVVLNWSQVQPAGEDLSRLPLESHPGQYDMLYEGHIK